MPASSPCSTCEFWDSLPPDASYGRCRVNPPQVVTVLQAAPDLGSAHWPLTAASDWCGAWAAIPP
jgi:hypothetical protein